MVGTHGRIERLLNWIHYMNWNTYSQTFTILGIHYMISLNT